ncbi:MAG TPA: hypothetical protein VF490_22280 [Chryseosolibacter sp.]
MNNFDYSNCYLVSPRPSGVTTLILSNQYFLASSPAVNQAFQQPEVVFTDPEARDPDPAPFATYQLAFVRPGIFPSEAI